MFILVLVISVVCFCFGLWCCCLIISTLVASGITVGFLGDNVCWNCVWYYVGVCLWCFVGFWVGCLFHVAGFRVVL